MTERYHIVADIGGTNARFATVAKGSVELARVAVLACVDYENFDQAYFAYCQQFALNPPLSACLSFACPVESDDVAMTNNHWAFSKVEMQRRLRLSHMLLLNDFTAMAYGMLCAAPEDMVTIYHSSASQIEAPRAVVGPGTGLGVSALVPTNAQEKPWLALSTEGGHISFAPQDDVEIAILAKLKRKYHRVSVERLLCGEGLLALYQAVAEFTQRPTTYLYPAEITAAALQGKDLLAVEVLHRFCRMLGAVVGDIVLAQGARGGVYLAGGILPRIQSFLLQSRFHEAMLDKGRMSSYLQQVPVWLAVAQYPGLQGAALALKYHLGE